MRNSNMYCWCVAFSALLSHQLVRARVPPPMGDLGSASSVTTATSTAFVARFTATSFEQILDHNDLSQGTFSQRYLYDTKYWGGPGYPIVVDSPVEQPLLTSFEDSTNSMTIEIAKAVKGAIIAPEMRYYGHSSPYRKLTTYNLRYLTVENILSDIIYLAQNVTLPFDQNRTSSPQKAPWIISGCSLSGSIAGWLHSSRPGTFWAYYADSAVVQAQVDNWQWQVPIEEHLGANCTDRFSAVIAYIDHVGRTGTAAEKRALQRKFGPAAHGLDFTTFANLLTAPLGVLQYGADPGICAAIRVSQPFILEQAVNGFAHFMKVFLGAPPRGPSQVRSSRGHHPGSWMDFNLRYSLTPYLWLCCSQFGWFVDGAPPGHKSIISRFLSLDSNYHLCNQLFPPEKGVTYGNTTATAAEWNRKTGGWFPPNLPRIQWTNSQYDPWRELTISSSFRPGGPAKSTPDQPLFMIPNEEHCAGWELKSPAAIAETTANMQKWVSEFVPVYGD